MSVIGHFHLKIFVFVHTCINVCRHGHFGTSRQRKNTLCALRRSLQAQRVNGQLLLPCKKVNQCSKRRKWVSPLYFRLLKPQKNTYISFLESSFRKETPLVLGTTSERKNLPPIWRHSDSLQRERKASASVSRNSARGLHCEGQNILCLWAKDGSSNILGKCLFSIRTQQITFWKKNHMVSESSGPKTIRLSTCNLETTTRTIQSKVNWRLEVSRPDWRACTPAPRATSTARHSPAAWCSRKPVSPGNVAWTMLSPRWKEN